jgi:DNA-binding NarL/FixJ family response regulator
MRQRILIAEPREIIRTGFRTILAQDEQIVNIYEARTSEDVQNYIHSYSLDLLLVHQSLVTELKLLPVHKLILLIDEPEIDMFLEAYERRVRGYLSTQISSELLFAAIHTAEDACLLDPVFLPWVMDYLFKYMHNVYELSSLSHREREVVQMLKKGLDRRTIAQQLHISEATLKTHIKNIARKQEDTQREPNIISYQSKSKSLKRIVQQ